MIRTLTLTLAAVIGFGSAAVAAPAPAAAPAPVVVEALTAQSGVTDAQWRRDRHDRRHNRWDRRHDRRHWHRPPPRRVHCENVRVRYFDGYRWRVRTERQCYPRGWR